MATVMLIAAFVTPSGASDASVDIVNHMGPGNPIQVSEQGEIWANSAIILTYLLSTSYPLKCFGYPMYSLFK